MQLIFEKKWYKTLLLIRSNWCTVLSHAPVLNRYAERMVGTTKKSIGRLVQENGKERYKVVGKVVS